MQKVIYKNIRWIISLISVTILLIIIKNLCQNDIEKFDNAVYTFVSKFISKVVTHIAKFISILGSAYVLIPIGIALIIIFWKKKEAIFVPINLLIIFIANRILKEIVARPRPDENRIVEELGYSFPSGHSMVSTAFYGLIIYLIYIKIQNPIIKWTLCISLSLLICLIGLSRIYLGVHYASDVLGGFFISLVYLCAFTHIIKDKINE